MEYCERSAALSFNDMHANDMVAFQAKPVRCAKDMNLR